MMQVVAVYSEAGGVSKTTTSVSLATTAAKQGMNTLVLDLDPRGGATKWTQVEPQEPGHTMNAILSQDDVAGYVEELALPVPWEPEHLRIVPASRSMSRREADPAGGIEYRVLRAIEDSTAELIVIDMPNRQGGPLVLSGLTASTDLIYAATPDTDGVDGVLGARETVQRFNANMRTVGSPRQVREAGIVLNRTYASPVGTPRIERASVEDLDDTGLLLRPFVQESTLFKTTKATGQWLGDFRMGQKPAAAYQDLLAQIIRSQP